MLTLKQKINKIILNIIPKNLYISIRYYLVHGHFINKRNPKTFTEKLQLRKLRGKNKLYTKCADKAKVRDYVEKKIGEKYLIPVYLVTPELTKEQFENLPNSFVLKATNGSGNASVKLIRKKSDYIFEELRDFFNECKKFDVGKYTMEEWYSEIPFNVLAEKLLDIKVVDDYKFHCFNSKKIFIEHLIERDKSKGILKSNFYDEEWNCLDFTIGTEKYSQKIEKPKNYDEMLEIAKKLSEDFDYVRVDLYNIDGKIYFGELTFCPDGGFGKFTDKSWDYKFGSYWEQPKLK